MSTKRPVPKPGKKMTLREEQFVRHMQLCKGNATQAAIKAGYSVKTAKEIAYQLMQRPHVRAAVEAIVSRTLSKLDVTVERVLQERARLAFFDPKKLFREDGTAIPINELDDDTAAAIAGFRFDGHFVGRGAKRKWVPTISGYKIAQKDPNLTAMEKYLGMYREEASNIGFFAIHLHLNDNQPSKE